MQLSVFRELVQARKIKQVIIKRDPSDVKKRVVVELKTSFGDTLIITNRDKTPRRFKDSIYALEVLNGSAGEMTDGVKIKVKFE